jgi:hypothetical protein
MENWASMWFESPVKKPKALNARIDYVPDETADNLEYHRFFWHQTFWEKQ